MLDVATSRNLFPCLQSQLSNDFNIVCLQGHVSHSVDVHEPCRDGRLSVPIDSFTARSSSVASTPQLGQCTPEVSHSFADKNTIVNVGVRAHV